MSAASVAPAFAASLREITFQLLSLPTAPFHEDAIAAEILRQLALCPHVRVEADPFGNLIARYQRGSAPIRWAFAAHMDHPAWVRNQADEWEFLGGVPKELLDFPRREHGRFAVWDLPPVREDEQGRIFAPACDDLAGCAAILAMFHELERLQAEGACAAIFTRAEEVGFVGAMEAADSGLIPCDWQILSLETSKELPPAVMGEGVIIRVGDRTSIFRPEITDILSATAQAASIPHQRCLMTGGTCEATAYALAGYACGALCVALGDYHNIGSEGHIAPEYVSFSDLAALSSLCVALIVSPASPADTLAARLAKNRAAHTRFHRPLAFPDFAAQPLQIRQAKGKG